MADELLKAAGAAGAAQRRATIGAGFGKIFEKAGVTASKSLFEAMREASEEARRAKRLKETQDIDIFFKTPLGQPLDPSIVKTIRGTVYKQLLVPSPTDPKRFIRRSTAREEERRGAITRARAKEMRAEEKNYFLAEEVEPVIKDLRESFALYGLKFDDPPPIKAGPHKGKFSKASFPIYMASKLRKLDRVARSKEVQAKKTAEVLDAIKKSRNAVIKNVYDLKDNSIKYLANLDVSTFDDFKRPMMTHALIMSQYFDADEVMDFLVKMAPRTRTGLKADFLWPDMERKDMFTKEEQEDLREISNKFKATIGHSLPWNRVTADALKAQGAMAGAMALPAELGVVTPAARVSYGAGGKLEEEAIATEVVNKMPEDQARQLYIQIKQAQSTAGAPVVPSAVVPGVPSPITPAGELTAPGETPDTILRTYQERIESDRATEGIIASVTKNRAELEKEDIKIIEIANEEIQKNEELTEEEKKDAEAFTNMIEKNREPEEELRSRFMEMVRTIGLKLPAEKVAFIVGETTRRKR